MADPAELLFLGFNRQVVALRKSDGKIEWDWKATQGSGYAVLLLDGTMLFVSVGGYTYALEAATGKELWFNPLDGYGIGVPTLAVMHQSQSLMHLADDASRKFSSFLA